MDIHQMWNISRYLELSVTFLNMIGVENLMQKVMKEYFLDTPQEAKLTNVWTLILTKLSADVNFDEFTTVLTTSL